MPPTLKFQCQLYFMASIFVASFANKAFLPDGSSIALKSIQSQKNLISISEVIREIRGGSGRSYGYENDYGDEDDYSRGYESGRGSSRRYDYDDDRNGDRGESRRDDYEDDYYGDNRDKYYAPARRTARSKLPDVGGLIRNGNKKVGMMLLGGGAVFTLLGISLFFNKTLMRLGNLLFIVGVPLFIGPGRTTGYFLQPKKARATGCLGLGIFLVFIGWPIFGIALEVFGILNLFGNMFPVFIVLLKQMPVIGPILKGNSGGSSRRKKTSPSTYRDSYRYDDEEHDRDYRDGDDEYSRDDGYSERYY